MIPCMSFLKRSNKGEVQDHNDEKKRRKDGVMGGICCGAALFVASGFQQIGVAGTTVGKAGFITALYIVIVPILWNLPEEKSAGIGLNQCGSSDFWNVSSLHDGGQPDHWKGRSVRADRLGLLFLPHFDH